MASGGVRVRLDIAGVLMAVSCMQCCWRDVLTGEKPTMFRAFFSAHRAPADQFFIDTISSQAVICCAMHASVLRRPRARFRYSDRTSSRESVEGMAYLVPYDVDRTIAR